MNPRAILVVEDDTPIRQGIVDALGFEGYKVFEAADGDVGMEMALEVGYDLLLLDLVLPGRQGLEILKQLREVRPTMPVIILTALGEESNRVEGLKLGADDYVVKPFSVAELLARVEAVLRRSAERPGDVKEIRLPEGVVDLERREARFADGERVELSEREAELLRYLALHVGRVLSRREILARVWRLDIEYLETRTIDMHVARLREKLRDDPASPRTILTVRGKGYMLARSE
jgi:DNA-binding response OmpR family regulator